MIDGGSFERTPWSVVDAAGAPDAAGARAAVAALCASYRYPLYAFIRRKGYTIDQSEDLVQGFFAHMVENNGLARAERGKGRFRTYLMACCEHYLSNQKAAAQAEKRGGARTVFPLDLDRDEAEMRYARGGDRAMTAERLFARRWAIAVLESATEQVEREMRSAGRARTFDHLMPLLAGRSIESRTATVAEALGISSAAVRMAATRLRARFRAVLREQIALTVSGPDEIEGEIRDLFEALDG